MYGSQRKARGPEKKVTLASGNDSREEKTLWALWFGMQTNISATFRQRELLTLGYVSTPEVYPHCRNNCLFFSHQAWMGYPSTPSVPFLGQLLLRLFRGHGRQRTVLHSSDCFLWESRTESGHNFPVFLGPLTYQAIFLVPPLGSLTSEVASEGALLRYSSAPRMRHHVVGRFSLKADTEQSYLHHYSQSYMLDPEGSKANLQFKAPSFFFFQTPGCCN